MKKLVNYLLAIASISLAPGVFPAAAQGVIWNGPLMYFTNTTIADVDQIVSDVWLTRATTKGLFNTAPGLESSYQSGISPAGTLWAFGPLANYATLTYTDWASCFGGSHNLAGNIVGNDAVVHLVNSDIYLSLQFTSWGGSSGGFSYVRSTPLVVPEPSVTALALTGLLLLGIMRKAGFAWAGAPPN